MLLYTDKISVQWIDTFMQPYISMTIYNKVFALTSFVVVGWIELKIKVFLVKILL